MLQQRQFTRLPRWQPRVESVDGETKGLDGFEIELVSYFVGPCTRGFTARDGIGSPNTSATKSLGSLMIIHQRVFENAFSNGQIVIKSRLRCAQGARARREET
jgi:hypothetical protein